MAGDHGVLRRPFQRAGLRADPRKRVEAEQARAYGWPHSILTGRPWPQPGEPLFLQEDTDLLIALAEEERDTCPQCGYPKAICRDPAYQFAFEPHQEVCWPTSRLAEFYETDGWKKKHESTKRATQVSAQFREGMGAPIDAGLDLRGEVGHVEDDEPDEGDRRE